jgi:hypothetical protein
MHSVRLRTAKPSSSRLARSPALNTASNQRAAIESFAGAFADRRRSIVLVRPAGSHPDSSSGLPIP